ncbi:hypothetical protein C0V70_09900 [Bacteriovorax stolpii]|uniref:Uncharacterized protein n=1 Tax=Bacteriovorax stolpii TaxID=960 RepID=A0A2K9NSB8_BACTC|nr:hypothetical protein [Bacteriovorax stolpii]AUN98411.1 hypothetical protein C0V70_09900 [Bacteriovorax stolpii]TDP50966.1 hypothetical protein C8D79_3705 [Bacteriovorax stolpii]BDT28533.1 hypothetical protein BHI3_19990 [Bacteriovorax sp. HI3]
MKLLIVAASMILSASAFALSSTTHDYSQVLGAIKLDNACITDSEVKSINPVKVCTNLEAHTTNNGGEIGSHTDWVCTAWENQNLAYSRAFEKTVCLKYAPVNEASSGECLKYGKVADFLPATIKVRTVTTHGEASTERTSWFSFPACE